MENLWKSACGKPVEKCLWKTCGKVPVENLWNVQNLRKTENRGLVWSRGGRERGREREREREGERDESLRGSQASSKRISGEREGRIERK